MTDSHTTVLDSYPSLQSYLNRLAELPLPGRLASLLTWIGDNGHRWSLTYLQPNWRKFERHETGLVELDSGDVVALKLADAELGETVADLALALGY